MTNSRNGSDNAVQSLFIYGTLLDPDIFRRVTGAPLSRMGAVQARLEGHAAVYAYGKQFPVLVPAPGGAAQGLLVTHLTAPQRRALDAYEGREWRTAEVTVTTPAGPAAAFTYVTGAYRPSREKFDLGGWQRRHKPGYMACL